MLGFSLNKEGPLFFSLEASRAGALLQYWTVVGVVLCQATEVVVRWNSQGRRGFLQ
jgi:hypothetical protein